MGRSQIGRRCIGSASSPPGFGSSNPSGPTPGHSPASSTAFRTAASSSRSSSGRSASSPAYLPSRPGRLRRPIFCRTARMSATVHRAHRGKAGNPSSAAIHSSPGTAPTGRCHKARQLASRCRSAAAGPPLRATSHLRFPTWTWSLPPPGSSASGSGTRPGAGGPPARIHL
eukprot:8253195-Lingulodinium_polyedra.AAC.1